MTGRHDPTIRRDPLTGRDSGHCGRRGCPCTHTAPCDHGWMDGPDRIDRRTGYRYEQVVPCPTCRPDAADRLATQLARESRDVK